MNISVSQQDRLYNYQIKNDKITKISNFIISILIFIPPLVVVLFCFKA